MVRSKIAKKRRRNEMESSKDSILSNKLVLALIAVAVLALISISVSLLLLNQVAKQNAELAVDNQVVEAEAEARPPVVEVSSETATPAEPEPEPAAEPEPEQVVAKPKAASPVQQASKPAEKVIYHETIEDAKRLGEEGWKELKDMSTITTSPIAPEKASDKRIAGAATHTPSGAGTSPGAGPGANLWTWTGR
jgi:type IV secretory pathway VirB10-like protein